MGFLNFLQGTERQLNPFDNNATYKNKQGNGGTQSTIKQVKDTATGIATSTAHTFGFLANAAGGGAVPEIPRQIAAIATGNKRALVNANVAAKKRQKEAFDAKNLAANSVEGLTFAVGGPLESKIAKTVAPGLFKFLAPKVANAASKVIGGTTAGAALGAPYNVANLVAGDEKITGHNVLEAAKSGITGGALVGGLATGVPLAVKGTKKGLKDANLIAPSRLSPKDVATLSRFQDARGTVMDDATYKAGVAAARKGKVDYRDSNAVEDLIGAHRNYDTQVAQRKEAFAAAKTRLGTPDEAGGIKNPSFDPKAVEPQKIADVNVAPSIIPEAKPVATEPITTPRPTTEPKPTGDPFDEILGAVNGTRENPGIAKARQEQDALLSKERGQRFGAGAKASENLSGSDAYFQRLKALKGEHTKVEYNTLADNVGPERAEQLFTGAQKKIYETPDSVYEEIGLHPGGARLNTERAVRKVIGLEPGLPTKSELKLLNVFSPKLAAEVKASTPKYRQMFDAASTLFGNVRSLKSSLDFSMGGRQGLFVAARHPVEWAKANIESVKYAKSGEYYKKEMKQVHDDEWGQFIDGHNKNVLTGGASHEEAFPSTDIASGDLAKNKLKVGNLVSGSERAYTGGLTKLRKQLLVKAFKAFGDTPEAVEKALGPKGVDGLIEAVSTLTGRGGKKGGFVEKHATTLQEALFSPRLWASRLAPLNPAFWKRIGPAGRKEAIQSLGSFAAVAGIVLTAAAANGADVETDPRSSDFLKIKVGDTRYDILGGFQQNLVFGARQTLALSNNLIHTNFNTTKDSLSGNLSKYGDGPFSSTALSAGFDLVRNKANPVLAAGANIWEGKDKAGNKINPLTEIGQLFVPISVQQAFNARDNPKDILKQSPDLIGIGSQTYGKDDIKLTEKQQLYADYLAKSGAPKEKVAAVKDFYRTLKTGPDRDAASKAINNALSANDQEKAHQIADSYNRAYAKNFQKWAEKYTSQTDKTLLKDYNAGKINLTSASIKTRQKSIKTKSLYEAVTGG